MIKFVGLMCAALSGILNCIQLVHCHNLLSSVHGKCDQQPAQQTGRTGVGKHWTCHLLRRTLHRCWQSRQLCVAGCAHVRGELIDRQQARPAQHVMSDKDAV